MTTILISFKSFSCPQTTDSSSVIAILVHHSIHYHLQNMRDSFSSRGNNFQNRNNNNRRGFRSNSIESIYYHLIVSPNTFFQNSLRFFFFHKQIPFSFSSSRWSNRHCYKNKSILLSQENFQQFHSTICISTSFFSSPLWSLQFL